MFTYFAIGKIDNYIPIFLYIICVYISFGWEKEGKFFRKIHDIISTVVFATRRRSYGRRPDKDVRAITPMGYLLQRRSSGRPYFLEDIMSAKQVNPFYRSRAWKTKREAILRRDGYLCKLSRRYGKTCPAETVHHIYPLDLYPEYALRAWNLISVSSEMHNRLHNREDGSLTAEGEMLMRATIPPSRIEEK